MKLIVLILVLLLLYVIFFKKSKKEKNPEDSEAMIECKKCGTFVSLQDAYIKDSNYYCSKECMNATS